MILSCSHITKSFGTDQILSEVSFHIEDKEKEKQKQENTKEEPQEKKQEEREWEGKDHQEWSFTNERYIREKMRQSF